jgi:hypothetical protein
MAEPFMAVFLSFYHFLKGKWNQVFLKAGRTRPARVSCQV